MFKFSLILMLVAVQLLSGSSRAVYVCVSSDGNFCCLDAGPQSCSCRHDIEISSACNHEGCSAKSNQGAADCQHGRSSGDSGCCGQSEDYADLSGSNLSGSVGASPCSHELMALGTVATVVRTSLIDAISGWMILPDRLADVRLRDLMNHDASVRWRNPPPRTDARLMALSTFVIRC